MRVDDDMKWLLNLGNVDITGNDYIMIFTVILIFIFGVLNLLWCNKKLKEEKDNLIKLYRNRDEIYIKLKSSKRIFIIEGIILMITLFFYGIIEEIFWVLISVVLSLILDVVLYRKVKKNICSNSQKDSIILDTPSQKQIWIDEKNERMDMIVWLVLISIEALLITMKGIMY